MIYLIGGPPRVGKTQLAQLICVRSGVPFVSTDALREIVNVFAPDFGRMPWDGVQASRQHAERFYPYLEAFVSEGVTPGQRYLVEGVEFLPEQAARLAEAHEVRSCFLGLSRCSLAELEFETDGNWIHDVEKIEDRQRLASAIVKASRLIESECARLHMPFVDMASDRTMALERAYGVVMES